MGVVGLHRGNLPCKTACILSVVPAFAAAFENSNVSEPYNVMGADAFDKKLAIKLRQGESLDQCFPNREYPRLDRKATITVRVTSFLAADDVSHTWDVYCTWNRKLFCEMTLAWKHSRSDERPAK